MIAFILGREFRLSIAEIYNFFTKSECIYASREIAFFEGINKEEVIENFHKIGGSIKVISIIKEIPTEKIFLTEGIKLIESKNNSDTGKFCYALAQYGMSGDLFKIGIQMKKELKNAGIKNVRLVNKDSNNINAAVYKKEKLSDSGIELNIIEVADKLFFGETIAYQDVDNYSTRDYGKSRDMNVGMLPPKLAQMMINLSSNESDSIYDPFCGLGTVLIEALNSGYSHIYGSDLNPRMVESATKNISLYIEKNNTVNIFEQDSARIERVNFLRNQDKITIVTEGYLGDIMTKGHVTEEKIQDERNKLLSIYRGFFGGLKKLDYGGVIVICFPFWELKGKYIYFEEIYKLIKELGFDIKKLLPEGIEFNETRSGSLLYHRPNQQVGREIFCLKLK